VPLLHPRNWAARQQQLRNAKCESRKHSISLQVGWVFLERTRILSGIHFTTHFIDLFVAQTKRFVGSFVNVILTRQTCDQRSCRAAESKRWALGNYFPERICNMFLMSKCRGDWDLGLCTFWVLAKREPLRNGNFRKKSCFARRKNRNLALRNLEERESPVSCRSKKSLSVSPSKKKKKKQKNLNTDWKNFKKTTNLLFAIDPFVDDLATKHGCSVKYVSQ